jgi:hypothetical protein
MEESSGATGRWKLQLSGESEELQALAKMFGPGVAGPVEVWREGAEYFLSAPEFDGMVEPSEVHARGELWVQRLNGMGLLKFGGFRPISGGPLFRNGGVYILLGTGVIYLPTERLRAYVDYNPDRSPAMNVGITEVVASLPPVERWANVADRYAPDVDDALLLLTQAVRREDWRLLYVVYEIIEDHVGARRMGQLGESRADINHFKHTANSRRALGTKARHGSSKNAPPAIPMTFRKAGGLVRRLLLAWMRSLGESASSMPRS